MIPVSLRSSNKGLSNTELGHGLLTLAKVLGFLGLLFIPFASYSTLQYRDLQRWQTVEASIERVIPRSPFVMGKRGPTNRIVHYIAIRYSYSFEGRRHEGYRELTKCSSQENPTYKKELARFTRLQTTRETVPVIVNPRRPAESLWNRNDKITFPGVVALWLLDLFLLLGWPACTFLGKLVLASRY